MRAPIHPHLFRRVVVRSAGPARSRIDWLGFAVRFPGRTPEDARRWLRAHGYRFRGRSWNREDRRPTRLTYAQRSEHTSRMQARRKRATATTALAVRIVFAERDDEPVRRRLVEALLRLLDDD